MTHLAPRLRGGQNKTTKIIPITATRNKITFQKSETIFIRHSQLVFGGENLTVDIIDKPRKEANLPNDEPLRYFPIIIMPLLILEIKVRPETKTRSISCSWKGCISGTGSCSRASCVAKHKVYLEIGMKYFEIFINI